MSGTKVKIRTLPRKSASSKSTPSKPVPSRNVIYIGLTAAILLGAVFFLPKISRAPIRAVAEVPKLQAGPDPLTLSVRRHIQDSFFKEKLLRRRRAIENIESQQDTPRLDANTLAPLEERSLGVQLDIEDTPDRLFKELNSKKVVADNLPEDRINARLANRKWMNEEERQERVQYVRNFVRSAYDRGYQVQLDQNLVVIGVKKIDRKVSIDQVLDKLDHPSAP